MTSPPPPPKTKCKKKHQSRVHYCFIYTTLYSCTSSLAILLIWSPRPPSRCTVVDPPPSFRSSSGHSPPSPAIDGHRCRLLHVGLPQIMSEREKRHIVLDNTLLSLLYFFHYPPFQRPLNLTPIARSGCGLYSLVNGRKDAPFVCVVLLLQLANFTFHASNFILPIVRERSLLRRPQGIKCSQKK